MLEQISDLDLNLNKQGINIDSISNNEPPRILISEIIFFRDSNNLGISSNEKIRANNKVKYNSYNTKNNRKLRHF